MCRWDDKKTLEEFIRDIPKGKTVVIVPHEDGPMVVLTCQKEPHGRTVRYREDMSGASEKSVENRIAEIQEELRRRGASSEVHPWVRSRAANRPDGGCPSGGAS